MGILGGTFDPPHLSHLELARASVNAKIVDRVVMVPCFRHAFLKAPAPFDHRVEMCRKMTEHASFLEVSDVEREMKNPGRTLELLEVLERKYPHCRFRLLVGADIYQERNKWYRFDLIEKKAPPLYFARKGVPVQKPDWLPAPLGISSSELRARLARGDTVDGFLDASVMAYIVEHRLYGVNAWEEKSL
ncbi:MAG: nicotinate-nicotinamide nucleotide adenylyltransferase [Deltaproteobacteria bacterium]|nr:nicotinate-nicotinamide nucleotide adenylyltransferase [Deltaproteobacteria bacterium]